MLGLIAKREFVEFVRDGRLYWAGGLVLILLLTALAVNWQHQRAVASERAAAQALDYEGWVSQDARHPHNAAHQGMHVFKPEPALSIIDPGITPYVGSTLWLQAHRQSEVKFRPAQDASGLQRFGSLSAAWVLQVLAPLLVIVLGFNAFAGEREQGTLRQTLSMGVSPSALLWGKALALGLSLALLFVPAGLLATVATGFSSEHGSWSDTLLRMGWLGAGYGLYLGIAVFVVLAVSARASSSRVALVVLLGLWIAGTLVAPRAISDLSRSWYPSPSKLEFNAALDKDLGSEAKRAWQEAFGVESQWGTDLPLNRWGKALEVDDHAGYGVFDRHFEQLWTTFDRQQQAQVWTGIVVPLLAVRAFSMGFAGTDFANHRDFSVAAERQRRVIQDVMSEDLIEHADPIGNRHFSYKADQKLWGRVPKFEYSAPGAAFALRHNWRSLVVLIAGLVAAVVVAQAVVPRRA